MREDWLPWDMWRELDSGNVLYGPSLDVPPNPYNSPEEELEERWREYWRDWLCRNAGMCGDPSSE